MLLNYPIARLSDWTNIIILILQHTFVFIRFAEWWFCQPGKPDFPLLKPPPNPCVNIRTNTCLINKILWFDNLKLYCLLYLHQILWKYPIYASNHKIVYLPNNYLFSGLFIIVDREFLIY